MQYKVIIHWGMGVTMRYSWLNEAKPLSSEYCCALVKDNLLGRSCYLKTIQPSVWKKGKNEASTLLKLLMNEFTLIQQMMHAGIVACREPLLINDGKDLLQEIYNDQSIEFGAVTPGFVGYFLDYLEDAVNLHQWSSRNHVSKSRRERLILLEKIAHTLRDVESFLPNFTLSQTTLSPNNILFSGNKVDSPMINLSLGSRLKETRGDISPLSWTNAFGNLAYEVLTGVSPYQSKSPMELKLWGVDDEPMGRWFGYPNALKKYVLECRNSSDSGESCNFTKVVDELKAINSNAFNISKWLEDCASIRLAPKTQRITIGGGYYVVGQWKAPLDNDNVEDPIVIKLADFQIDKWPVTKGNYAASGLPMPDPKDMGFQHDDAPMTGVTWMEAAQYAAMVGGFLPHEIQWEAAARGQNNSNVYHGILPNGVDIQLLQKILRADRSGPMAKLLSDLSIDHENKVCFMTGLIKQWCGNIYEDYYRHSENNFIEFPPNTENYYFDQVIDERIAVRGKRVLGFPRVNDYFVANRYLFAPNTRNPFLGFRVAYKA